MLSKYEDRIDFMLQAASELEQWLIDVARQGLATLQQREPEFYENIASRLVDLKMGGIAHRIRRLATQSQDPEWRRIFSAELAELYLFARRFLRIRRLPEAQQMDLLQDAGLNLKKKDVVATGEVWEDNWLVLGRESGVEENIRYRRTWLWGERLQRPALILDFSWGSQPFERDYLVGQAFAASLHLYPGAFPLRSVPTEFRTIERPFARLEGYPSIGDLFSAYAGALERAPGLRRFPALLADVVPFMEEDAFFLLDARRDVLPLQLPADRAWQLIALSGGTPVMIFGEWDGGTLHPLCAVLSRRIIDLGNAEKSPEKSP